MTDEERLDRLERIVRLVVRAGLRELRGAREKINPLIDAHVKTEEAMARMAEAQAQTDKRLDALIDIARDLRNGKSDG